jgi:hypothetical protein
MAEKSIAELMRSQESGTIHDFKRFQYFGIFMVTNLINLFDTTETSRTRIGLSTALGLAQDIWENRTMDGAGYCMSTKAQDVCGP